MLYSEMVHIKDKVKFLLEKYPDLRDNDYRLIAFMHLKEIGEEECHKMTGMDFLKKMANQELINTESIRRVRQKIQEKFIELRGDSYKNRKIDGETTSGLIKDL